MIQLGLERISRLLATTSFPWRAIHVAGTNGKGSICAYALGMLQVYNGFEPGNSPQLQRVSHGRFTSPHLIDKHDCITINGETIALDDFRRIERRFTRRNVEIGTAASSFEIMTATAFAAFTEANVDVGIVEVGVGGRLDATNILGRGVEDSAISRPSPLVTAISSLGLDHRELLGNTIEQIATEKAGIIKPRVPVIYVHHTDGDIVNRVIERRAGENQAPLVARVDHSSSVASVWETFDEAMETDDPDCHAGIPRSPNGAMALQSVWVALHGMGRLQSLSKGDKQRLLLDLAKVPSTTTWPGRFQLVDLHPFTGFNQTALLDGAHNAQSASYLKDRLHEQFGSHVKRHYVAAFSEGKDCKSMLETLVGPGDALTAVQFGPVDGMPWVKAASDVSIYKSVPENRQFDIETAGRSLHDTLKQAAASARASKRLLIVTGSLYLVADVLRLLRQHTATD